MTPMEIACRRCDAQPQELCICLQHGADRVAFHAERIEDAAAMSRVADPVSVEAFDSAVDEGGLV